MSSNTDNVSNERATGEKRRTQQSAAPQISLQSAKNNEQYQT